MTATLTPLTPQAAHDRIATSAAVLVDIREADEYARRHVPGALSQPLSGWEAAHLQVEAGRDVIFTCRSGMRTAGACDRLAARVSGTAFVLEGGVDGWAKPVCRLWWTRARHWKSCVRCRSWRARW